MLQLTHMNRVRTLAKSILFFLNSSTFFYIIVGLFILESLWIALSFRFPMVYDEGTHFDFIQKYSSTFFPYTIDTPLNMTTQVSLFHYVMSFVYRVLDPLLSQTPLVIVLRVIGIGFVASGLVIYRKILQEIKVPRAASNVALLLFVLLPIVPLVSATINADNLLFPVTAVYILVAVRAVNAASVNAGQLMQLVILGCIASLVKFTFLPVFFVSVVFITVLLLHRHKTSVMKQLVASVRLMSTKLKLIYASALVLLIGLFSVVFIGNLLTYQSLTPDCFDVYSQNQCRKSGVISRNIEAKRTADSREAVPLLEFTYTIWFKEMQKTTNKSGNSLSGGGFQFKNPLQVMDLLLFIGTLVLAFALAYSWKNLPSKNKGTVFAISMFFALTVAVYLTNLQTYYTLHAPYAIQPRYLLSLLPIFLGLGVWSVSHALGRHVRTKIVGLFVILLLFTQGGGVLTHMISSEENWYWQDKAVVDTNKYIQSALQPLIKE